MNGTSYFVSAVLASRASVREGVHNVECEFHIRKRGHAGQEFLFVDRTKLSFRLTRCVDEVGF
jgi:hypothetical protein